MATFKRGKYESSFWNNDSVCCQGHRCSFFLAIIATYAASAMRATPIIQFLATPTGTVAMIICSLAIMYITFLFTSVNFAVDFFFYFLESFNLLHPLLMITLYD